MGWKAWGESDGVERENDPREGRDVEGAGLLVRGHLGKEGVLLLSGQEDEVGVEKKFFQPQTPNTSLFKRK